MLKRLAIMAVVVAAATWNHSPSVSPQSLRPNQGAAQQAHKDADHQHEVPQPTDMVEVGDPSHGNHKFSHDAENVQEAASKGWGLGDKIALGACIFAGLQFIALILTIAIMIRNGRRQLRAYVVVERGIIANVADPPAGMTREKIDTVARILDPQTGPHAQITIKNTGQTPAYNLVHWALIDIREFPLKTQFPTMPKPLARYWNVLGSGVPEVKTLRITQRLTTEQVEGLRNGTMAIYCHGEIRYRDAFKKSRRTRYRCMYSTPACGVIGVGTDLVYCEEGNEAD